MLNSEFKWDDLYREAAATSNPALERLVRAYEADTDERRDLAQEIHFALWRSFENYESVSLEELRARARTLDLKMRRGVFILATAAVLHTVCEIVQRLLSRTEFTGWIGAAEFATLVIILLYWPWTT